MKIILILIIAALFSQVALAQVYAVEKDNPPWTFAVTLTHDPSGSWAVISCDNETGELWLKTQEGEFNATEYNEVLESIDYITEFYCKGTKTKREEKVFREFMARFKIKVEGVFAKKEEQ